MNYRHIFHAGNFADVVKHLALVLVLDHLRGKDKPFVVLDAFAGIGLYDFTHPWVHRNPEYQNGIEKVIAAQQSLNQDTRLYVDIVKSFNQDQKLQFYPGSPLIIAKMLRENDRLFVNELHPDDYATLADVLSDYENVRGVCEDAYVFLRANLPPDIKRGLVLIDPPYEDKSEFEKLASQMAQWKKRWATGTYMIWYPIKYGAPVDLLIQTARTLEMPDIVDIRFQARPSYEQGLTGTGLLVLNAPYLFEERMKESLRILDGILKT